jgi:hypothetical protein
VGESVEDGDLEEQPAEPPPLVVVDDRDGEVGDHRIGIGAHPPHDPGAHRPGRLVDQRPESPVVDAVDRGQEGQHRIGQPGNGGEETAVAALGRQPGEARHQQTGVAGQDRTEGDVGAVAEADMTGGVDDHPPVAVPVGGRLLPIGPPAVGKERPVVPGVGGRRCQSFRGTPPDPRPEPGAHAATSLG